MFLEQALKQTLDLTQPLCVLDLCAAPGGKSTLIQSLITSDSLLVSNEVIKSRSSVLEENLTKWGAANTIVTNNDPRDIGTIEGFFDVIVIDAPCSGSGLFRREPEAINEWSEQNVQLCCQRQQRILADIYPSLKKGGILVYSTCSYSRQEDEDIMNWLSGEFNLSGIPLLVSDDWGIKATSLRENSVTGYRFFPDKVKGEGFFLACFRKNDGDHKPKKPSKRSKLQKLTKDESLIVQRWLKPLPLQLWKQGELIFAFPAALNEELLILADSLYIRKAGVLVGKFAGNELIPDHALALSSIISDQVVGISLKKEEALQYLRKEEVKLEISERGWALVNYNGLNLGWIKILPNRINNYYPKEWRILKSGNN
jgi:NOL1/NOP2/fmu family ribosome biogenesis protein